MASSRLNKKTYKSKSFQKKDFWLDTFKREHTKLYTAFGFFVTGASLMITYLFHPFIQLIIVGGITWVIALVAFVDHFFQKNKKEQSALQHFEACLEEDVKILKNLPLDPYEYYLRDWVDAWEANVAKNIETAYGMSDSIEIQELFKRNWEFAQKRTTDSSGQLRILIEKNIDKLETKIQQRKPIPPKVDPKDFKSFKDLENDLLRRQNSS